MSNELNEDVTIEARDGSRLTLSPLQEHRSVTEDEDARFALRCWPGVIEFERKEVQSFEWVAVFVAYGVSFVFVVPWAILAAFFGAPNWWLIGWGAMGGLIVGCVAIDLLRKHWHGEDQNLPTRAARWMRGVGGQHFYLLLGLVVGFVLPAAAIFFASDLWSSIDRLSSGSAGALEEHVIRLTLIGRLMQVTFVGIASLTPALLFFVFDREHLKTLRRRFMRQIMRFDPSVETRRQVIAKYGEVMDEAYGQDEQGKILPGRRSPILLATLLITLGWTFTLLHGDMLRVSQSGIATLFEPRASAASFAFLGAYFYGLNVVLRGYVRRDLRAKTYSALTVRILIVVVLSWVLDLVWGGTTLYVLAFLTGIFPDTALVLIKETVRSRLRGLGGKLSLGDEESDPLTKLEGVDLYDLARLFDEGVTNVQGLATHDVVELMLQTRIPAPRILDWVDQAILYLHAGPAPSDHANANRVDEETEGNSVLTKDADGESGAGQYAVGVGAVPRSLSADRETTLATLRLYGIRTATDLFNAYEATSAQGEPTDRNGVVCDATGRQDLLEQFLRILPGAASGATPRIQAIVDVLKDEEWINNLKQWRQTGNVKPKSESRKVSDLRVGALAAAYRPSGHDPVEVIDADTLRIDGWYSIDEFNTRFGASLPQNGYHTVAGFVASKLHQHQTVHQGEEVAHENYRFHVDDVQDTLIGRLTISPLNSSEADSEAADRVDKELAPVDAGANVARGGDKDKHELPG